MLVLAFSILAMIARYMVGEEPVTNDPESGGGSGVIVEVARDEGQVPEADADGIDLDL